MSNNNNALDVADEFPPGAITDLSVTYEELDEIVTIEFTSPGDDEDRGKGTYVYASFFW